MKTKKEKNDSANTAKLLINNCYFLGQIIVLKIKYYDVAFICHKFTKFIFIFNV